MKAQILTTGIVLTRIDFQEADRILTILTPDHGKLRAIAKGVRRPRSKLAGGIELLSISHITYLPGRGELGTLISTRLITHFGNIVQDIQRTMLAYEFLKRVNRITEDAAGEEYFSLVTGALEGLHNLELSHHLTNLWFRMQLLRITGHAPNLHTTASGVPFTTGQAYIFSFDDMAFAPNPEGPHSANLIKLFRLAYAAKTPTILGNVQGIAELVAPATALADTMLSHHIKT